METSHGEDLPRTGVGAQPGKPWSREWEGLEEVGVVSPRGLQLPGHQLWEQDFRPRRLVPSSGEKLGGPKQQTVHPTPD